MKSVVLVEERLFQAGVLYHATLPKDVDWSRGGSVDHNTPAALTFQCDYDTTCTRMSFWWTGSDLAPFHSSITMSYHVAKAREPVITVPWSSIAREDTYMRQARSKVARAYRDWPWCEKCKTEKRLVEVVDKNTTGTVSVYLECAC